MESVARGLLGMIESVCDALVMGNSIIMVVPTDTAELAIAFAEALHTSDVPGGVVNILTGDPEELVGHASSLEDLDCIWVVDGVLSADTVTQIRADGAHVMRRIAIVKGAKEPCGPHELQKLSEIKTVWMSSGADITGGAAY